MSLISTGENCWEGTYIGFHDEPTPTKTHVWTIRTTSGDPLGKIKWYAPWRKYCFYPIGGCVFETVCLGEIIQFIKDRMQDRKK